MTRHDLDKLARSAADMTIARSRELGRPLPRHETEAFYQFISTLNALERLLPEAS